MEPGAALKRVLSALAVLSVVAGAALADDGQTADKYHTLQKKKAAVSRDASQTKFKLDFSDSAPSSNSPGPPPGASTLRRDSEGGLPFLGLKLTKPLGN